MALNNEDITLCHHYQDADKEYVFVYKGQPFATSVLSCGPTPHNTLIDATLVRNLKLKMTDYKCQRFNFAGQNMRCVGKVSTFVQYVKDGMPLGQFLFSATVVRGLTECLDVESIAGPKVAAHLTGCSSEGAKGTPSPKRKKAKTSPKKDDTKETPKNTAPSVPAMVPGVEAVVRPEAAPPAASAPPLAPATPPRAASPAAARSTPPPSPPGFPTPKFPRPANVGCVQASPPRFPVKRSHPNLSPLSSNLRCLDDEFWNADEEPYEVEKQILEMNGAADSRYYACSLQELSRNDFAFTKLDSMNEAYHYWSGHGRNKCSPACLKLPGPLPNNCGFHPQFKFPAKFRMCSERCKGAFCLCLRSYV